MNKILWVIAIAFLLIISAGVATAFEVKPTGRIYANFNYNLSGYPDWDSRASKNDFAEFALARAYLGVKASFNDQWTAKVISDITRPTYTEVEPVYDEDSGELTDVEVTEEKGPYTYYVKYAYGQYQPFDSFGFRVGMMPTPFIDRYEKAWGFRYVEKTPSDRVKWDSSADLGFAFLGDLPGKFGSYYAMIRNGEGYKHPEHDSGKAVHARLLLTPFQMSEATKKLQLTTALRYERVQREEPEITNTMLNTLLSYKVMFGDDFGINLGGGYDWQSTATDIEDDDTITGQIIHGYGIVYLPYKLSLFGRVDMHDPDTENDKDSHGYQDETTYLLAGISVDPVKKISFALDVKQTTYTAEVEDDKGDTVTKSPDTYLYIHSKFKF